MQLFYPVYFVAMATDLVHSKYSQPDLFSQETDRISHVYKNSYYYISLNFNYYNFSIRKQNTISSEPN
jgi:hypothetical protein